MNSVTLLVEPHPPRTERIVLAGWNDNARVVIGRVGKSVDDLEFSGGAGTYRRSHRDAERAEDFSVLYDRELSIWDADENLASGSSRPGAFRVGLRDGGD